MANYKFRLLTEEEIDVRVGNIVNGAYKKGANLLLYKNARVDMDILDETVGAENWTRSHQEIKGNLYCNVSIYDAERGQWVTKQDCGVESNTEKEKGEASDSFKRACVNWGIGRELYTSPRIFIEWEIENGKLKYNPTFVVEKIAYDEKRRISALRICALSGGKKSVVFDLAQDSTPQRGKETHAARTSSPASSQPVSPEKEQQALDFVMTSGKYSGYKLRDIKDNSWLEWASKNFSGKWKEYVDIVLSWKKRGGDLQDLHYTEEDDDPSIPF